MENLFEDGIFLTKINFGILENYFENEILENYLKIEVKKKDYLKVQNFENYF